MRSKALRCKTRFAALVVAGFVSGQSAFPVVAQTAVIDRLDTVAPYLMACVQKRLAGQQVTGQREMTFRLAYRRDGTLIGLPRRTHSMPPADQPDQAQVLADVGNAILSCSPLPFSKELGEAMAGRTFPFRIIIKPSQDRRA